MRKRSILKQRSSVSSITSPLAAGADNTPTTKRHAPLVKQRSFTVEGEETKKHAPLIKQRSFTIEGEEPKKHAPLRKERSFSGGEKLLLEEDGHVAVTSSTASPKPDRSSENE